MLEIKVECDCGQRYKFDVEPVQGRMPFAVKCPICGLDGTAKANVILENPLPGSSATSAPNAAAPKTSATPPPARCVVSAPAAPRPAAAPAGAKPSPAPVARAASRSEDVNLPLGVAGAIVAGIAGMLAWYILIKLTGYEIGYAAWGVGVLTGLGAKMLGRQGSPALGITAAVCAFAAILGGDYLAVKAEADKVIEGLVSNAYQRRMEYARAAEHSESDDKIKALLVKYEENASPSAEDIREFKERTRPGLKEFAASKESRERFERRGHEARSSLDYNLTILKESVGLLTVVFLLLGVSSAYKIGAS